MPVLSQACETVFSSEMKNQQARTVTRYIVISPVRNEAEYLETTIKSMVRQTILPLQWIIVNDGSTDGTAEIIDRWAAQYSWIVPVHCPNRDHGSVESKSNRGKRAFEAKEIQAFHVGFEHAPFSGWDYIVKLDGDLGFGADYFERCFSLFEADPKLGIGGGVICHEIDGEMRIEPTPSFHVRGATKIYRRACWLQIGGVVNGAAWDTIDEVKANMLGWQTCSFEDLKVAHFRFTGTANGAWKNSVKLGTWSYIAGYHPLYMVFRCLKGVFAKPRGIGSLGMFCGFLAGYLRRVPQAEEYVVRYLRQQQLRRLVFLPTIWR
jgi:glycosyltransferase involved in cell wall biosynthesis